MKGLNPGPLSPAELRENQRVTNEVLDELYFRRVYDPGRGHYAAGAAVNNNSRGAVVDFPNAGNPAWRWSEVRLARWLRAGIYAQVRYTVNAAGGGNFSTDFQVGCYDSGDNLATITMTILPATIASPAANSDVLVAEYLSTASTVIPGNKDGLAFVFRRISGDAADTSANVLQVLSIHVKVLPQ